MGADYRALGVARSLGRKGIPVWLISQGGHLVATVSRYVERCVSWLDGTDRAKVDYLVELSARHKLDHWLLFPTDDHTVSLVSTHFDELAARFIPTVPRWQQLRWACDKRLLHLLARELAISQPWTACPNSREDLAALDCPFPVILKPALRTQPSTLATPKAWLAKDRDALLRAYDQASSLLSSGDCVIQEIVPGGGETQFSYAALCKNGRSLASIVARRTRQFPRDFGQLSTYVETVNEPQVSTPAEQLLSALRFTGLAEVEFKKDPRNGQYKVLDINPRVWGWHTLARRVGVDFPYLLWLLLQGKSIPEVRGRAGEKWVHLSADLRLAIGEILSGRLSLREYLQSIRGPLESALFSWDDPLPGLLDLPLFAYTSARQLLGWKR